ncbi:MAG: hypothetical protein SPF89_02365 [Sphaerochaetaceae bacterium]|nr:hypothetical protein [Spirochaetales bacterium]MDY5498928.1 hypothetical protein [Sphaerochaetaceae bacterium]
MATRQEKLQKGKEDEKVALGELDDQEIQNERAREVYHRVRHITMSKLLYLARQTAKSYDQIKVELDGMQQALDEKKKEIRSAKTPVDADEATRDEYNDKRKALREERDALARRLTIATSKIDPIERLCDIYDAVASWKSGKAVGFRKQPRTKPVDPDLQQDIEELKRLLEAKGYYTTIAADEAPVPKAGEAEKTNPLPMEHPADEQLPPVEPQSQEPAPSQDEPPQEEQKAEVPLQTFTSNGGDGPRKHGRILPWILLVVLVVVIIIAVRACSGGKSEEPEKQVSEPVATAAPAPAKAASAPSEPAKASQPAVPEPAKAEVATPTVMQVRLSATVANVQPEPKKQAFPEAQATMLGDGTQSYQFANGVRLVVYPDGSMKTFFGNLLVEDAQVVDLQGGDQGQATLVYADGTKADISLTGAVIDLGHGFVVVVDAGGFTTTWQGKLVTDSPIVGYSLDDGVKTLHYAAGLVIDASEQMAAITMQRITLAISDSGMVTSFMGMPITRAALAGFDYDGEVVTLRYDDGMSAAIGLSGASIALKNGISFAMDAEHTTTSFAGVDLLESPIASYELDDEDTKHLVYAGGKRLDLFANGDVTVSLPEGVEIALNGEGAKTTYLGFTISEKAIADFNIEEGAVILTYLDGTRMVIGNELAGVQLPNGLGVTVFPEGIATTVKGMLLNDQPIDGYRYDDGKRYLSYADGMKVESDDAGPITVTFANGLTVAAQSGSDMRTFWQQYTLSESPVDMVVMGQSKEHALHYADDTVMIVLPDGSTALALSNGLVFATDGVHFGTMYGQAVVSDAGFADYSYDKGARRLTYADGTVLDIDAAGWVAVTLPNGVQIASTPDGFITKYGDLVVSRSPIVDFSYDADGRTVFYADGMVATLGNDGSASAFYPNYAGVKLDSTGLVTTYGDETITTSDIARYQLAPDGSKQLVFTDGTVLALNPDGSKVGEKRPVASAGPVTEEKEQLAPVTTAKEEPVAIALAEKKQSSELATVSVAKKERAPFRFGLGVYGSAKYNLDDDYTVLQSIHSWKPALGGQLRMENILSGEVFGLGLDVKAAWEPETDRGWSKAFKSSTNWDHWMDGSAELNVGLNFGKALVTLGGGMFMTTDFDDIAYGMQASLGLGYHFTDHLYMGVEGQYRYSLQNQEKAQAIGGLASLLVTF